MRPETLGHLAMFSFSILVAGSFSLGGLAAPHIDPVALNAVRFAIASLAIWITCWLTTGIKRKDLQAPWRYLLLGGVFSFYFVMMFEGLKTANPVSTSAVFTFTPIMSAVFGWLLLRQITTRSMALALGIGGIGALWVIFRADITAVLAFEIGLGERIFFWGCVAHALYTPLVRLLNRGEPALTFTFLMLSAACVLLWIYGWSEIRATDWANLPTIVYTTILYTSIFASSMTFFLLQFATMRLPSAKVMAYTYLIPSWVILWEIALGNAAPTVYVLGGVALTVMALLLLLRDETAAS
ncbi:DMT family transporter [Algirhabdus cladophorae]|uniref:DMT family transporter n=1 Tax=Algirhabdus cladophorae TaxID=3377108 RepID=UPI003B849FC5